MLSSHSQFLKNLDLNLLINLMVMITYYINLMENSIEEPKFLPLECTNYKFSLFKISARQNSNSRFQIVNISKMLTLRILMNRWLVFTVLLLLYFKTKNLLHQLILTNITTNLKTMKKLKLKKNVNVVDKLLANMITMVILPVSLIMLMIL